MYNYPMPKATRSQTGQSTRTCTISAARFSQNSGKSSVPDLSLCRFNWSTKTSWTPAEPIGNSDQLPTAILINHRIRSLTVVPNMGRWCSNDVDWSSFTNKIESHMQQLPQKPNILICITCFNNILTSAASIHVNKIKSSKKPKPWTNPHVHAKIHNQNRLCCTIH